MAREKHAQLLTELAALDGQLGGLVRLPSEPEEPFLAGPIMNGVPATRLRRFACCFKPHVPIRYEPSTSAGVVTTLPYGAMVTACARRGRWVRLHDAAAPVRQRWMLTCHPLYGELLKEV